MKRSRIKRKKKSPRKKLKDQLDDLCRAYIKQRDDHTCQKCGKKVAGQSCQWSHVVPRARGDSLRWDVNNCKVLCGYCHRWWHSDPLESSKWFEEKFPERHAYLEENKGKPVKFALGDLEDKIEWFKTQLRP